MNNHEPINLLHTEWQALQPLKPEDEQRLWKKLRLEWNYHSNHIEGNTLTYGETASLLIHDQAVGDHELRNYVEMKAHDLAIEHLRTMANEDRPLTEADIRDLNRILLKEPFRKEAITPDGKPSSIEILPGQYKEQANNVRTADGGIFKFASPAEVPARMAALIQWYRQAIEQEELHPVEIASKLHHDFVLIHPFGDGNGRTARLLVNYVLMQAGYPPIIVPSPEKDRYLAALRQADAGDLQPLTDYLAICTTRTLERGILAGKGESIEEPDDLAKEIEVFKQRQNGETTEVAIKSADTLKSLYNNTIQPLFEEFVKEHQRLDDLFLEVTITPKGVPHLPTNSWLTSINNFITGPGINNLQQLSLQYAFRGFKGNASTPFNLVSNIRVVFSEYQYTIDGTNISIPKKLYTDSLSESERREIVNFSLEHTFNQIKKQSASE